MKELGDLVRRRIDDRDLVGLRQRHIGFLIASKGNTCRLVKHLFTRGQIEVINDRGDRV